MARTARKEPDDTGEIKNMDFAGAVRAYRTDIKPALSKVGDAAQEASTAYKHIKKNCHIQPGAAKLAFKLDDMEEAKRADFLRGFVGLLNELNIPLQSADLVDQAEGKADKYARPKPAISLVTLNTGDDSDLADPSGVEPESGTGAAAMAAMRAADAEQFDED